ncbi:MAG: hypothetical protein ACLS9C_08410 [Eubacterium sp.]
MIFVYLLVAVIGYSLNIRVLKHLQVIKQAVFYSLVTLNGINDFFFKLSYLVRHFLVDFGFGRAGKALAFSLAFLILVPNNATPSAVCSFECIAVCQQLLLHFITPFAHTISQTFFNIQTKDCAVALVVLASKSRHKSPTKHPYVLTYIISKIEDASVDFRLH